MRGHSSLRCFSRGMTPLGLTDRIRAVMPKSTAAEAMGSLLSYGTLGHRSFSAGAAAGTLVSSAMPARRKDGEPTARIPIGIADEGHGAA